MTQADKKSCFRNFSHVYITLFFFFGINPALFFPFFTSFFPPPSPCLFSRPFFPLFDSTLYSIQYYLSHYLLYFFLPCYLFILSFSPLLVISLYNSLCYHMRCTVIPSSIILV
nr:MAG TPA: hypothetical protein [Caudoviricetes sp.]